MEKNKEYYESLDKRSKEYKAWKKSFEADQSKGLGDDIAKITKATGIDKAAKWLLGEDCGCDERQEKLNKLFPARRVINCLTEEQYNRLDIILNNKETTREEERTRAEFIIKTYSHVFNVIVKGGCTSCTANRFLTKLKQVFETYQD